MRGETMATLRDMIRALGLEPREPGQWNAELDATPRHVCSYPQCHAVLYLMTPEYQFDTVERSHVLVAADCGLFDAPATLEDARALLERLGMTTTA